MERLGGVRPLAKAKVRLVTPPPPADVATPRRRVAPEKSLDASAVSTAVRKGPCLLELLRAGDGFAFAAAGIDRQALRELEKGLRRPEATLDLHGQKTGAADALLAAFVHAGLVAGRRVLHVVHGRGRGSGDAGPVLRRLVLERLTRGPLADQLLALVAAPPGLGGPGASLVWLRKKG